MSDQLRYRVRPPAADPAGALVLLHGRGADEHDLHQLIGILDPERRLVGITPRGPLSLPPGGAHWYAVREVGYPDPETFHTAYSRLTDWLDGTLADYGLDHGRTVIGGFSQGTVMSYAVSLASGRPRPAGILGLSGFIPTVPNLDLDLSHCEGLPVAIGHGTHDPVIGVEWGRDARDRLAAAGANVSYHESPIEHQIDPKLLFSLPGWLESTLSLRA